MISQRNLQCSFAFIPYGAVVAPEPGRVFLDVGNRLSPGVIDHHQPGAEEECATSLVRHYPHYVLGHLAGLAPPDVTLVTHIAPDLDAVTAGYFCHSLIVAGRLPRHADLIANYVKEIDQGICFRHPGEVVTVYGVFTAICELIKSGNPRPGQIDGGLDLQRVLQGFAIWDYVLEAMAPGADLHRNGMFQRPHPFEAAEDLIVMDHAKYLDDLAAAAKQRFSLPLHSGGGRGWVDALLAVNPASLLFRSWARGDNRHAPGGRGFCLLAVNYDFKRYIISVDPQSPYTLKGLGDLLEAAETEKRRRLGAERVGDPRPGYASPDPWYDGRNPLHNFTIVDTPRGGTVLTWEEILAILSEYGANVRAAP